MINKVEFFRVDARRRGTNGKQETFRKEADARKRAAEIAKDIGTVGTESFDFPAELRGMALTAERMLKPYGKTVLQAAEFYKAHLDHLHAKQQSATVSILATRWCDEKKSGLNKSLRPETIRGREKSRSANKLALVQSLLQNPDGRVIS